MSTYTAEMIKAVQRNGKHESRPSQLELEIGIWGKVGELVGLYAHRADGEIWRVVKILSDPFELSAGRWSGMVVDAEFVQMARPDRQY